MSSSYEPVAKWRVAVAMILWAVFMASFAIFADGKKFTGFGVFFCLCAAFAMLIILVFAFCFESYGLIWRIVLPVLVVAAFILVAINADLMGLPLLEQPVDPIEGVQASE